MRFTVCASISPVIESLQVAALLVGSVACFAYMMTYEILKSVQHARRLHVMKSLQRKGSVEDYGAPNPLDANNILAKRKSFGAEAVIAAMTAPSRQSRRRSLFSLAYPAETAATGTSSDSQAASDASKPSHDVSKAPGTNWNVNPMKSSHGPRPSPHRNERVLRMTKSDVALAP
jgi:hypothetical protein